MNSESKKSLPEIGLPQGGSSHVSQTTETFRPGFFTGGGSYSVSFPVTSCRGLTPGLSVDYDSSSGNSPYGLGFNLGLLQICLRTEKGTPGYSGKDIYTYGSRELVAKAGNLDTDHVWEYLPRREGDFTRFLYHREACYWELVTTDNTHIILGRDCSSRIYDPDDESHIYSWLVSEMEDCNGNKIRYSYKCEDDAGISGISVEQGRSCSNKYPLSVKYGNYLNAEGEESYCFEVLFDYGQFNLEGLEHGGHNPYAATGDWSLRPDAFSSYRSGFEIRTRRLCRNLLLFHHFEQEVGAPALVSRLSLEYEQVGLSGISLLKQTQFSGYLRQGLSETDAYQLKSLPPIRFSYSGFTAVKEYCFGQLKIDGKDIPGSFNSSGFRSVDLDGEGIAGLLYGDGDGLIYFSPEGNGNYSNRGSLRKFPTDRDFGGGRLSFDDLEGRGELQLVYGDAFRRGFYPRDAQGWKNFQNFSKSPVIYSSPGVESVSLSNNGKSDLLVVDNDSLQIYPSQGKEGYGLQETSDKQDGFPSVKRGDRQEYVGFGDLLGDRLSHRVRIRNGKVECWPSLGYGRFGKKRKLGNAPVFGDGFDSSRLFLVDITGTGLLDIAYVYPDRVAIYLNQSGNSFSEAITIDLPEKYSSIDSLSFADVEGFGSTSMVFSKMSPSPVLYYLNFLDRQSETEEDSPGIKPYLLTGIADGQGGETILNYTSSTRFYLADKQAGVPWKSRLPFPVQVLEGVTHTDHVTGSRMVSRYCYHDGYYDHIEKEFRGFGLVESWDTESGGNAAKEEKGSSLAPVYTKIWHFTGASPSGSSRINYHQETVSGPGAYYRGDKDAYCFPDIILDKEIDRSNETILSQAYSALRGTVLRTEVYGQEQSEQSVHPYSVSESNVSLCLKQPADKERPAVFQVLPVESISCHYERNPEDPRISQSFVLETDSFGNPLKSCQVSLARRSNVSGEIYPEQQEIKAVVSVHRMVTPPSGNLFCHQSFEHQSMELLNLAQKDYYTLGELQQIIKDLSLDDQRNIVRYGEEVAQGGKEAVRLLSWKRIYYWDEALGQSAPLSVINSRGLLHHSEAAAYPEGFFESVFNNRISPELQESEGGYRYDPSTGYWWGRGLTTIYDREQFFLPVKTVSGFVEKDHSLYMESRVEYDRYGLYPLKSSGYVDSSVWMESTAVYDYRLGRVCRLTDANENTSEVLFDALGQVVASSVLSYRDGQNIGGMRLQTEGAEPAEYQLLFPVSLDDLLASPSTYLQGATSYFYYDLWAWEDKKQPPFAVTLSSEYFYHGVEKEAIQNEKIYIGISYFDGFGRVLEEKQKTGESEWQVSGKTVYNNKGLVYKQYLPYCSGDALYEEQEIGKVPPSVSYYDPLGRLVQTTSPKGFFSKVEFTPWEIKSYDANDTVKDSEYYRTTSGLSEAEQEALDKAAKFYDTPSVQLLDSAGRVFCSRELLEDGSRLDTLSSYDGSGRVLQQVDPRLSRTNREEGTCYYNFKYRYPMNSSHPVVTDSSDGGIQVHFDTCYGEQLLSWSARDYCQLVVYDHLRRQKSLLVKKTEAGETVTGFDNFPEVEHYTYGEESGLDDSEVKENNLFGKLWETKDLSGIVKSHSYHFTGQAASSSRVMLQQYKYGKKKYSANWKKEQQLEDMEYSSSAEYNAQGLLTSEHFPDGSTVSNQYDQGGRLTAVNVVLPDGKGQEVINSIRYDALGQRTLVKYGNGITSRYTYEPTTLRLVSLRNERQTISYTYDPAGNITRISDSSFEQVFNNNQQIVPESNYTYDSLYRLIGAEGREHPALGAANTTNSRRRTGEPFLLMKGDNARLNDSQALENYREQYEYDASGNLVKQVHHSASSPRTTMLEVEAMNNHLMGICYDASGNQLQPGKESSVRFTFNCCDNLVQADLVERDDTTFNDCEYYDYDSGEERTRKVLETLSNGELETEEKVYLGGWEVKRRKKGGSQTYCRNTLRVMDGSRCVAVIYTTLQDNTHTEKEGTVQWRYQLDNHLGSVAMELSQDAGLISYEEYFPYGGTAFKTGSNQTEVDEKEYAYAGKERDGSTGLYYYGRRYYAPWQCRWLKPDPAGTVDGLNLYAFVGGNPVNHIDIGGLMSKNPNDKYEDMKKGIEADYPNYEKYKKEVLENEAEQEKYKLQKKKMDNWRRWEGMNDVERADNFKEEVVSFPFLTDFFLKDKVFKEHFNKERLTISNDYHGGYSISDKLEYLSAKFFEYKETYEGLRTKHGYQNAQWSFIDIKRREFSKYHMFLLQEEISSLIPSPYHGGVSIDDNSFIFNDFITFLCSRSPVLDSGNQEVMRYPEGWDFNSNDPENMVLSPFPSSGNLDQGLGVIAEEEVEEEHKEGERINDRRNR